jgi:hypothetical protein
MYERCRRMSLDGRARVIVKGRRSSAQTLRLCFPTRPLVSARLRAKMAGAVAAHLIGRPLMGTARSARYRMRPLSTTECIRL